MTQDTAKIVLNQHDAGAAGEMADELADLFQSVYQEHASDRFFSREQFLDRLRGYRAAPGYTLITAREDSRLVGFLYGYPLPAGSRWWDGLTPVQPDEFTAETGTRTFAVNDMAVPVDRRRRGIAQAMHGLLLADRPGMRFTLAVMPSNTVARAAYRKWGYRVVGQPRPAFPDAPPLDLMVLER
jgi:ribosomal protein S18 acetylase RimI-like enzyme